MINATRRGGDGIYSQPPLLNEGLFHSHWNIVHSGKRREKKTQFISVIHQWQPNNGDKFEMTFPSAVLSQSQPKSFDVLTFEYVLREPVDQLGRASTSGLCVRIVKVSSSDLPATFYQYHLLLFELSEFDFLFCSLVFHTGH